MGKGCDSIYRKLLFAMLLLQISSLHISISHHMLPFVIIPQGICNFGKLNYYLGARAAEEGRESRYPDINFCEDPGAICASQEHKELKWIAGMFYWVESLQSYSSGGWEYINELKSFVDGGMIGNQFIDAVSGIVNRGCHNPPCASGGVDGGAERAANFLKVLKELGL